MQLVIDVFAQIFRTLWAHKLRSFLTMFGIAWGVGSLLLLVGLGEGFRTGNKRNLNEFGENIMMIFPGRAPVVQGIMTSARYYHLTYRDYLDMRTEAPHVRTVVPILTTDVHAVSEFASASGQLTGAEPQYNGIRFLPMLQGRWLNDLDESQKRNVVVLLAHGPMATEVDRFDRLDNAAFSKIGQPKSWYATKDLLGTAPLHGEDIPTLVTFTDVNNPKTARVISPDEFEPEFQRCHRRSVR